MIKHIELTLVIASFVFGTYIYADDSTWVLFENKIYGAKPDKLGPIGGGAGYVNIITNGDYNVEDLNALLNALSKAKAGEVVFITGETEIDLTARIYIEQLVLEVPAGVTLAGNRGYNGSKGALLTSDALKTPVIIRAAGSNVRITGLRIQGPNSKRYLDHHSRAYGKGGEGRKYYYKFPNSRGIQTKYSRLEVDNCEISAFSHAGIYLVEGDVHHIHHNFIHHCQYQGLGYGVCQNRSSSLIEYNLFNWNRHSISATGLPGCSYTARHNVQMETSLSHCFDMHGGRDRGDGTNIAGTMIEIYNNSFHAVQTSVMIRGVPQEKCEIYHNWFPIHRNSGQAVKGSAKTVVENNLYGTKPNVGK